MATRFCKQKAGQPKVSVRKEPSPESDDESGLDTVAVEVVVQKVKIFKPVGKVDLMAQAKLDKMMAAPVLQAAFTGVSDDASLAIMIKKRLGGDVWTTVIRDCMHSTNAFVFNTTLNPEIQALSVPALLQIDKFSVRNEQNELKIIVNGFTSIATSVELPSYIAKKLPLPTLFKTSAADNGKTEKVDVFDLEANQRNIELEVELSNVKMRDKSDGTFFITFDCQDHTGTVKGVAWENVEVLSGVMKNGITVSIKKPTVKIPEAMYTARYTSKMEITLGKNTQLKVIRK